MGPQGASGLQAAAFFRLPPCCDALGGLARPDGRCLRRQRQQGNFGWGAGAESCGSTGVGVKEEVCWRGASD